MNQKTITKTVRDAYNAGRRLVAPLMGFPGLQLKGSTIKLAQQNYGEHYKVIDMLVKKFKPDIVFPLMDLSVEANALGRYTIFPRQGTATVIKEHFEIAELTMQKQVNIAFDTRLMGYVETMKLMSIGLPEEVIKGAYVTGPYSLAGLIMGAEEAAMATIMEPDKLTALCEFATEKIEEYIRLLICAGAQVICILEPTAVMLGPEQFEQFSSGFVRHINENFRYADVATVYHTCGNTMHLIGKMVESKVDAISLDSPDAGVDLPRIAGRVDGEVILIGNINPTGAIFKSNPGAVQEEVMQLLQAMDPYPNFVLSTGCDLPQETPIENISAFMNTGKNYRIKR
jgi:uroporphyrinogen decarboxylase